MASMLYSLIRVVLDAIATSQHNEAKLRAEVLALRQQVQVLERQIKRVRCELLPDVLSESHTLRQTAAGAADR
jgi:predicted  nucleic acid-binding Zn-ribbon protein